MSYVLIQGDPVDGFAFTGPFESEELALAEGRDQGTDFYWIADLMKPFSTRTAALPTFEVVEVIVQNQACYTVIRRGNAGNLGGDHHWLNKTLAESAMKLYKHQPDLHGESPVKVEDEYKRSFAVDMPGLIRGQTK